MKNLTSIIALLTVILVYPQQKTIDLNWGEEKIITTSKSQIKIPSFTPRDNFRYTEKEGVEFIKQWEVEMPVNIESVGISNINYATITIEELKDVNIKSISSTINFKLKNTFARNKQYVLFNIFPIVKEGNNTYKKIVSFTINYKYSNKFSSKTSLLNTITNSVLNTGTWHKFVINKTGVFKLDKAFLNALGINTNTINPKTIKIFGNGGKMLPYANSENYPLDPIENAIKVIGEDDGVFNDNDYVLFYGEGPKGNVDDVKINTNLNPYTDTTYYYITTSGSNGKRIEPMVQPVGTPDTTINTFHDYQFHELDEYSLAYVGRRWFGDEFDIETTKTFDFSFPNLVTTEPVKLKVIGASPSQGGSTMAISFNNTEVGSLIIPNIPTTSNNLAAEGLFVSDINTGLADDISIRVDFDNLGNPSTKGYIDYIALEAIRDLSFSGNQFVFFNKETVTTNGIGLYTLSNASSVLEVWDITDKNNITAVENSNNSSSISFKSTLGSLKTFVTVSALDFFTPLDGYNSQVANQNIKGTIFKDENGNFKDVDYIIVTPSVFFNQAKRLAEINKNKHDLNVKIVTLNSIYTEFSTGNKDISAIRNMLKYVYDNASAPENRLKYVCFFGDSSFDYKERVASNTYYVPTWNAYSSFNLTTSFVSDDFYGMMDANEGRMENTDLLDINIGRILADTPLKAKQMVDKIETYYSQEALGSWRNNFVVISDDVDVVEEFSLQETTDLIGDLVTAEKPFINVVKIHTDSFEQESSAGGDRYPKVATAISNAIENGALVVNYFGHGGEDGLASERIFQKTDVSSLRNECQLNC
ncbi:type IX secretion system sortase PorU, partial [Pontimicrobium sp. MEBiC01747]